MSLFIAIFFEAGVHLFWCHERSAGFGFTISDLYRPIIPRLARSVCVCVCVGRKRVQTIQEFSKSNQPPVVAAQL